jgi:hypothetical protein
MFQFLTKKFVPKWRLQIMKVHKNKVPVLANTSGVYMSKIFHVIYEKFFTPNLSFC